MYKATKDEFSGYTMIIVLIILGIFGIIKIRPYLTGENAALVMMAVAYIGSILFMLRIALTYNQSRLVWGLLGILLPIISLMLQISIAIKAPQESLLERR